MNTVIKRAWNKNKLVKVEDLTGMTFQAESGGHTFEISGVDDTGAAVSLSGTVEGRFLRADNAEIIISGTASGGKASVTLSDVCYAIPGRFLLTIYVTSGGQKVAVYAATGSVVATSGTASGSIPPLVTDSVQANTGTFGSISTGDATVDGVLDVTQRRCYASLSQAGWYRVIKISSNISDWSFAVDFCVARSYANTDNEVHAVKMLRTYGTAPSFVNEDSKSNNISVTAIRYTVDSNGACFVDIRYNANSANTVAVDFTVHIVPYLQRYFTAESLQRVDPFPSGETVLAEYTFAAITGMRVVHAQSSTSFGDAIAKIKDIIDDNNITHGGNAANNLHAGISGFSSGVVSISSSGGPVFFAILGKYSDAYYAAELFTYNYPWRIRIRNMNGTYFAEIYYPNY